MTKKSGTGKKFAVAHNSGDFHKFSSEWHKIEKRSRMQGIGQPVSDSFWCLNQDSGNSNTNNDKYNVLELQ